MRMSRKELERELKWECNATQLEKLWRKYAEEESTRLRKQLAEAAEENNKLRMVMNSMMHQQNHAEGDYLLREEVKSVLMRHGRELENSWHGYAAMVADVLALPSYKPRVEESDEYIDGYADAMQDMEKFLEKNLKFREEVGSET